VTEPHAILRVKLALGKKAIDRQLAVIDVGELLALFGAQQNDGIARLLVRLNPLRSQRHLLVGKIGIAIEEHNQRGHGNIEHTCAVEPAVAALLRITQTQLADHRHRTHHHGAQRQ
jgi:hypothetical protein